MTDLRSLAFIALFVLFALAVQSVAASATLGLPPLPARPQSGTSQQQIKLGRLLFFDKALSADGTISCSTCHDPSHAFSDGRPLAQGIGGKQTTRNAPSLFNVAFNTTQFWDGRRSSLEEQALDPFLNPREHGLRSVGELLQLIRKNASYVKAFKASFGIGIEKIGGKNIASALASYQRTLVSADSAFDRYYYGKEPSALSASAQRGLNIFTGAGGCSTCHVIQNSASLFTDHQFHSINVGLQKVGPRLGELTTRLVASRKQEQLLDADILSEEDLSELGRFVVTLRPADIGKFKTPSLRNVALTGPYMHDGSVSSLEEAVERELYNRGTAKGRVLILTPVEKADLVAFLLSLTSTQLIKKLGQEPE